MKNFYILVLIIFSTFYSFSQTVRVDYGNSSKWFLGINGGGTWHSTDVKYLVGGGWGLTLGKSFNYNYGRPLSFDIRARYLTGNWYGQDKDSTALSGLTQDNALYGYQSAPGYTYHNFKSNIHRLALELAIHLNAITQRTGWDPYVFGGVGITWNQTMGNLTDSLGQQYQYTTNGLSNVTLDKTYETALDGYSKYQVNFMPSLGFGLGYHIGKRTTIGVEHKTTFTLNDNFDAVSSSLRPKNDRYHYTSMYLQFRFRGHVNGSYNVGTNSNGNGFVANCPSPVITIGSNSNLTVTNPQFDLDFRVTEVNSQSAIQILNSNNIPVSFNFNTASKQGRASVTLMPGANTFTIKARNKCGNDSKTFTVIFNNCSLPSGTFTNPNQSVTVVKSPAFVLGAIVSGIQNKSSIKIYANGNTLNNFTFNSQNGMIQANVNLIAGVNTFKIELSNSCGSNVLESNVTYDDCIAPSIVFTTPSATGTTMNTSTLAFRAKVEGINNKQQINLDVNGVAIRDFVLSNGVVTANLSLSVGLNTISLKVANSCGTDSKSTTVSYQTCNAPIVTILSPTQNSKVSTSALRLKTKIENIQSKNNIKIQLNGNDITSFTFTNGANGSKTSDAALTLINGVNVITVSATNNCGTDVETITVDYENCIAPVVTITSPMSETSNSSYLLTATINNMSEATGISVSRNGQDIGFNFANGQLSSAVTLVSGLNTFLIKAIKPCGIDSKTIVVNYRDCESPLLTLSQPAIGTSVNTAQYSFSANVSNIVSLSQVTVTLNNQSVIASLNSGVISGLLTLVEGNNTLTIKVTNSCGMDVKTVNITRVACTPPVVSIINPLQNSTVTRSELAFEGTIQNASNYVLSLNGMTINASKNGNLISSNISLIPGSNLISLSATNNCGNNAATVTVVYNNCVAPTIALNSGSSNQTVYSNAYNLSATVTNSTSNSIAFSLNGTLAPYNLSGNNFSSTLTLNEGLNIIVISTSNACGNDTKTLNVTYVIPTNNNGSNNDVNNSGNNGSNGNTEEKIIICHYPPGNTGNPQQLEIPLSAWPAHQLHGDLLGPCPNSNNGNGNNGGGNSGNNGNSGSNSSGNNGLNGNTEEKIIICHYPPGNTGNPQQLEIPLSAWPAHQLHGDLLGPCPNTNNGNGNNGGGNPGSGANGNNGTGNSGNNGNSGNSGGNDNNGHGNNEDGVDVSNPGQGGGGPNGATDQSGNVDDESNGGGADSGNPGSGANGNIGTGNSGNNGNNGNSGGNDNNGHGNNEDGVDVSNPGQGEGGPNGATDQSGNVDDESNGGGADAGNPGSGANANSGTGNNSGDAGSGNSGNTGNESNNGTGGNEGNSGNTGSGNSGNTGNGSNNGAGGNNGNNSQGGGQKSQQSSGHNNNPSIKPNGIQTKPNSNVGNSTQVCQQPNKPSSGGGNNSQGAQKPNKPSPSGGNNSQGGQPQSKPNNGGGNPGSNPKPNTGPKVNNSNKGGGR